MNPQERRRSQRYKTHQPIRLYQPPNPRIIETLTKDVSDGGVRCISPQLFPVSTDLNVEIILFKGEEPFTVKGKAAWFRIIPHSEQFDLGVCFANQTPYDKRRLSVYLSRLAAQAGSETFEPSVNISVSK